MKKLAYIALGYAFGFILGLLVGNHRWEPNEEERAEMIRRMDNRISAELSLN